MDEPLLSEAREWSGYWWMPQAPDEKLTGVLSYDPQKGLRLHLIGAGWMGADSQVNGLMFADWLGEWPVIHGEGDGQKITLLNTHALTTPRHKQDIYVHTALVGCHLLDERQAVFIGGHATVENMTAWSRRSGIGMKHHWGSAPDTVSGEITLTQLSPKTVDIDGLTAKLGQWWWQPYADQTRYGTRARVNENASIAFSSDCGRPLREWLDLLTGIADLVSLSTLTACGVMTMSVQMPATPEAFRDDHPERDWPREIDVYQDRVVKPEPEAKAVDPWTMVLTLDDVPFEELIPRWLQVRERFSAARSMILGLQYVSGGYLETKVVTAVAAAESFHRALNAGPPIPKDQFKALRNHLLEVVPDEYKSWVRERLAQNAPSLKERLLALIERLGDVGIQLIPDGESWAIAAGRARNTLAHSGPSGGHTRDQLRAVIDVTSAVVILNLMQELGVPEARMLQSLTDQPTLRRAVELAAKEYAAADKSDSSTSNG